MWITYRKIFQGRGCGSTLRREGNDGEWLWSPVTWLMIFTNPFINVNCESIGVSQLLEGINFDLEILGKKGRGQ